MAIISDDEDLGRRVKKNPVIKPETIEYDNTFENSIRPKTLTATSVRARLRRP